MDLPESVELTQLRAENAQLRAKIGGASTPALPWWKSGATITTLTAIVVASVPVTTAVQGWVQKNRELALEDRKQTENIRTSYLERLKVPGEHLRTLRFVIATTNDSPLRAWAEQEKKVVEGELRGLDDEIKRAEEAVDRANKSCSYNPSALDAIEDQRLKIVKAASISLHSSLAESPDGTLPAHAREFEPSSLTPSRRGRLAPAGGLRRHQMRHHAGE